MSSTSSLTSPATPSTTESIVADDDGLNCGGGGDADTFFHLRIASIFVILIGSTFGAVFPVFAYRSRLRHIIPKAVFDFAKYFGSGVIIATAFIHLLDPALEAFRNPCLTGTWQEYPWALALSMFSIFFVFFVELFAFRWGTAKLQRLGLSYDAHGHGTEGSHAAHGPEGMRNLETATTTGANAYASSTESKSYQDAADAEIQQNHSLAQRPGDGQSSSAEAIDEELTRTDGFISSSPIPQIIGIFIFEFGIVLHSALLGLTLAVDEDFKILFVVIVFHQIFEGLGLGSRLAYLKLPTKYNHVAYSAAILYGLTTPLGIAIGLGVRTSYNPESSTASAVQGIMDALSSGVLIYTGLVELLAHEFLFSPEMERNKWSDGKLVYACGCMVLGAGLMSLLGRWA